MNDILTATICAGMLEVTEAGAGWLAGNYSSYLTGQKEEKTATVVSGGNLLVISRKLGPALVDVRNINWQRANFQFQLSEFDNIPSTSWDSIGVTNCPALEPVMDL